MGALVAARQAQPIFCKDSASRIQRKFTFYVEAQPIFCKDSASRRQRKFTFYVEAQPIFCKGSPFLPYGNFVFLKLFSKVAFFNRTYVFQLVIRHLER